MCEWIKITSRSEETPLETYQNHQIGEVQKMVTLQVGKTERKKERREGGGEKKRWQHWPPILQSGLVDVGICHDDGKVCLHWPFESAVFGVPRCVWRLLWLDTSWNVSLSSQSAVLSSYENVFREPRLFWSGASLGLSAVRRPPRSQSRSEVKESSWTQRLKKQRRLVTSQTKQTSNKQTTSKHRFFPFQLCFRRCPAQPSPIPSDPPLATNLNSRWEGPKSHGSLTERPLQSMAMRCTKTGFSESWSFHRIHTPWNFNLLVNLSDSDSPKLLKKNRVKIPRKQTSTVKHQHTPAGIKVSSVGIGGSP